MHTPSTSTSRVQWVVPPSKRPSKKSPPKQANGTGPLKEQNNGGPNSKSSDPNDSSNDYTILDPRRDNRATETGHQVIVDAAFCKTIGIIVGHHLKELREHQMLVNRARAKLLTDLQEAPEANLVVQNDISRLRIRDEQTKAIQTIKQLNNYLRELSLVKRQTDAAGSLVNDEIHNGLSELRSSIIQALNDFVLTNSDIDVPVVDCEDSYYREYDLCFDAQRSTNGLVDLTRSQSDCGGVHQNSLDSNDSGNSETLIVLSDKAVGEYSNQEALVRRTDNLTGLERRKKDLQRLERDTVELRKLFSDFYSLVKIQSEQVDSIEDNIVIAEHRIRSGQKNLERAAGLTVLVPVAGCITGALLGGPIGFVVGGKIGGFTVVCAGSLLGYFTSRKAAQKCYNYNVGSKLE